MMTRLWYDNLMALLSEVAADPEISAKAKTALGKFAAALFRDINDNYPIESEA